MISETMCSVLKNLFHSTTVSKLKKQMERWRGTGYIESSAEISWLLLKLFEFVLHVDFPLISGLYSVVLNCP